MSAITYQSVAKTCNQLQLLGISLVYVKLEKKLVARTPL